MIKQCFNLIEIALAIAIIAVGLSSILVLFPVGLNATNDAAADNTIPDVADYMLGYLECYTQANWRDADGNATENSFLTSLKDKNPENTIDENESEWHEDTNGQKTNLAYKDIGGTRIFRYAQTYEIDGNKVTDFSAIMRVWKEKLPIQIKKDSEENPEIKSPSEKEAIALCVEISYPAEKPYDAREKQFFRREIYNQAL